MRKIVKPVPEGGKSPNAAFTLTELLAVLAALALLVCVALPALSRPQGQVKIAQCADNLRQLCLGIHLYGHDNNERLPINTAGNWLWDMARPASDAFLQSGLRRANFYCPGFPTQNDDSLWGELSTFRVTGYGFTLQGQPSLISTNVNPILTPQPNVIGAVSLPAWPAAQRVLVADATISQGGQNSTNTATQATYNFTTISGGFSLPHRSPHLLGRMPAGGNLVMLDGHVEWRNFSAMIPRTQGGTPVFWW